MGFAPLREWGGRDGGGEFEGDRSWYSYGHERSNTRTQAPCLNISLCCPFYKTKKEVLFIDADAYVVKDMGHLFNDRCTASLGYSAIWTCKVFGTYQGLVWAGFTPTVPQLR